MKERLESRTIILNHSFVQLLGYMRAYFHLAYRQTEGVVVKAHARRKVPSIIPDYSTISRRVNKVDIKTRLTKEWEMTLSLHLTVQVSR